MDYSQANIRAQQVAAAQQAATAVAVYANIYDTTMPADLTTTQMVAMHSAIYGQHAHLATHPLVYNAQLQDAGTLEQHATAVQQQAQQLQAIHDAMQQVNAQVGVTMHLAPVSAQSMTVRTSNISSQSGSKSTDEESRQRSSQKRTQSWEFDELVKEGCSRGMVFYRLHFFFFYA